MAHADIAPQSTAERENGDETWPLYSRCPDACDRLNVFQWEWIADRDHEARAWIRRKRKPVSQERGVNTVGLVEACEESATVVQEELHRLPSPLTMDQAVELWHFRHGYLNALLYLRDGHRLAKEVEAKVAPSGQPLAICLGSNRRHHVETFIGPMTMQGYTGCLRTFPDLPFGRGRRWPRLCPECEPRRSNDKNKAISELQRRVARSRPS